MTEDDFQALPPRPRRRLLGAGGSPIPLALLGVLLIACGFIAGVLVEKGQTASGASGHPSGRNRPHHRGHEREGRSERRIDPCRRQCRQRWPRCAVRRLGQGRGRC